MNDIILKNIEKFGMAYCDKYLKKIWDKDKLSQNSWYALKFFFSHSFMRGRKDELSNEYYYFTVESLKNFFKVKECQGKLLYEKLLENKNYLGSEIIRKFKKKKNLGRKNSIKHPDFSRKVADKNPLIKALISKTTIEVIWDNKTYKKELSLGNDTDIMMVLDTLHFVSEKKNIYSYIKKLLEQGKVKQAYNELKNIYAVADKIATFFIRDIMLLNSEIKLQNYNYKFAFPIDTWIFTISEKLNIGSTDLEKIKEIFIKRATKNDICPLKLAAGLWYLGFNSLDILIDKCLDKEIFA